ncbi:MAG: hypothetical protein [Olavius algarvensis Gamma 1 endosymbiont]|nr:MAG: hypothetical protein [Olavius algarvensis Gamma 1 endosymbiont]
MEMDQAQRLLNRKGTKDFLISKMIQPTPGCQWAGPKRVPETRAHCGTGCRVRCADPMRARRPRSQEGITFATPVSAPILRSLLGVAVVPC